MSSTCSILGGTDEQRKAKTTDTGIVIEVKKFERNLFYLVEIPVNIWPSPR